MQVWSAENHEKREIQKEQERTLKQKEELELKECERAQREQDLRNEDLRVWMQDKDETENILRIMRKSGDIAAKPVQVEAKTSIPTTSQLQTINFTLKDPSIANHAVESKAKRIKKKDSLFTVDLGMAKQAVLVRGHGIGSRGAIALAAELSTGAI